MERSTLNEIKMTVTQFSQAAKKYGGYLIFQMLFVFIFSLIMFGNAVSTMMNASSETAIVDSLSNLIMTLFWISTIVILISYWFLYGIVAAVKQEKNFQMLGLDKLNLFSKFIIGAIITQIIAFIFSYIMLQNFFQELAQLLSTSTLTPEDITAFSGNIQSKGILVGLFEAASYLLMLLAFNSIKDFYILHNKYLKPTPAKEKVLQALKVVVICYGLLAGLKFIGSLVDFGGFFVLVAQCLIIWGLFRIGKYTPQLHWKYDQLDNNGDAVSTIGYGTPMARSHETVPPFQSTQSETSTMIPSYPNSTHQKTPENSPKGRFCSICGHQNMEGARFCQECGRQLD